MYCPDFFGLLDIKIKCDLMNSDDNEISPKVKRKFSFTKLFYSVCSLVVLGSLGGYGYVHYYGDQLELSKIKSQHFTSDALTDAKTLDGLEVVAAISPKEKLALLDGLTQAKATELVLKLGETDINGVVLFKTPHPLLYLAYGTNCAGQYKYSFVTPAQASSAELLLKPPLKANVLKEQASKNPFINSMPIVYTNQLYESRISYFFHTEEPMHDVKEDSEEEMLDISVCLEGGKFEVQPNVINEENVEQARKELSIEIDADKPINLSAN